MKKQQKAYSKPVYVVDGCRTPFLKAREIGPFSASDLAVLAGAQLLKRQPFLPQDLDAVVLGCVMPGPEEVNIARLVALRLGCGDFVPAHTVMRNCASGLQSLDTAALEISAGRAHLVLAGGAEAMSHAPLLLNQSMVRWLSRWQGAKQFTGRLALLAQLRPSFLVPVVALLKGLTDPLIGLNMGQTAEELAFKFGITREEMDEFASLSHQRAAAAYTADHMQEVCPIFDKKGNVYTQDTGIRTDSTPEKLAKLKPFFDRKFGMVTAGNSSQVTDGAAMLLLASEEAVKRYQLPILGEIIDVQWSALDPAYMGPDPLMQWRLFSSDKRCRSIKSTFEINEAFAVQVMACMRGMADETFVVKRWGSKSPWQPEPRPFKSSWWRHCVGPSGGGEWGAHRLTCAPHPQTAAYKACAGELMYRGRARRGDVITTRERGSLI